jgi:hypothetical protein
MKFFPKIILVSLLLLLADCKKGKVSKDNTNPTITLIGDANLVLAKGAAASDPGATASDDKDGDISSRISSDWSSQVNTNNAGDYTVTYSVKDEAGNSASTTRSVKVKYGAASTFGNFNATHTNSYGTSGVYTSFVTAGDNADQFSIYPFSGANVTVKVNMSGPSGTDLSYSTSAFGNTYAGYGTISNNGNTINLTYTVYTGAGNYPHTSVLNRQ